MAQQAPKGTYGWGTFWFCTGLLVFSAMMFGANIKRVSAISPLAVLGMTVGLSICLYALYGTVRGMRR